MTNTLHTTDALAVCQLGPALRFLASGNTGNVRAYRGALYPGQSYDTLCNVATSVATVKWLAGAVESGSLLSVCTVGRW